MRNGLTRRREDAKKRRGDYNPAAVAALEFIVMGTPVSVHGSAEAKRFWQLRVTRAAEDARSGWSLSRFDELVLRVAYFYVYAPAADLDNIVKPLQDALKGIAFEDDIQVVDLIASMRRKGVADRVPMTALLAAAFGGGSDFIYVAVDRADAIEVFR
jgi:crossover junction endodeoxyribonuclease RusA